MEIRKENYLKMELLNRDYYKGGLHPKTQKVKSHSIGEMKNTIFIIITS